MKILIGIVDNKNYQLKDDDFMYFPRYLNKGVIVSLDKIDESNIIEDTFPQELLINDNLLIHISGENGFFKYKNNDFDKPTIRINVIESEINEKNEILIENGIEYDYWLYDNDEKHFECLDYDVDLELTGVDNLEVKIIPEYYEHNIQTDDTTVDTKTSQN